MRVFLGIIHLENFIRGIDNMKNMKLWKWDLIWGLMLSAEIISCIGCSIVFWDFRFMGIGGIALFCACLSFLCAFLTKSKTKEKTVQNYFRELQYTKKAEDLEEALFPIYFIGLSIFIWLLVFTDIGWIF